MEILVKEIMIQSILLVQVHEHLVPMDELMDADEVFCTSTTVVISPVGSITYLDRRWINFQKAYYYQIY